MAIGNGRPYHLCFKSPLKLSAPLMEHASRPILMILFTVFGSVSCQPSSLDREFKRAADATEKRDFKSAAEHFHVILEKSPDSELAVKSAQEGARISLYELRDFSQAVGFLRHVILYSKNSGERLIAQKKIADLFFNHLQDYKQSIEEWNLLLDLPHTKEEEFQYRINLTRSYFYLSQFSQAQSEIDDLLRRSNKLDDVFDALLIKANIYLTTKELDSAIQVLNRLITQYPKRAKEERIAMILAVCYEEQKNYGKAIEVLATLKDNYPRPEFIERRIKTLRERQSLLPGARGLKK